MTTLQLLRDVLEEQAEAAATADGVDRAARRWRGDNADTVVVAPATPRRRRPLRVGLAVVAAFVIAATVVAVFLGTTPGTPHRTHLAAPPPTDAGTMPVTDWQFSVAPDPGGATFLYQRATPTLQYGLWVDGPTRYVALLQVTVPVAGHPVPARPADASDVAIAGTTGWSLRFDRDAPARDDVWKGLFTGLATSGTLTVWTDAATGLTVSMAAETLSAERVAQLAGTVQLGVAHPVQVPFRASWLPADVRVTAVNVGENGQTDVDMALGDSAFNLEIVPDGSLPSMVEQDQPRTAPTRIGPYAVDYRPTAASTFLDDGAATTSVFWGPGSRTTASGPSTAMPLDQLTLFVDGFQVADLADASTWFDLADSVHR